MTHGCGQCKGGRLHAVAASALTLPAHTSAHLRARASSVVQPTPMKLFTLLTLLALSLSACPGPEAMTATPTANEDGEQRVDQFEYRDHRVIVYFTDPLLKIMSGDPKFLRRPSREQADALSNYLHHNEVYRFVIERADGESVGELVMEGDPDITDSAAFYRIVDRHPTATDLDKVNAVQTGVRGMLFEHMAPFQTPEGRSAVGKGIALFEGIFMMVTPYSEVKTAMLPHIEQITG